MQVTISMCVDLRLDQQLDATPAKSASLYSEVGNTRCEGNGTLIPSSEAIRALLGCHYLSGVLVTSPPLSVGHDKLTGFHTASRPR